MCNGRFVRQIQLMSELSIAWNTHRNSAREASEQLEAWLQAASQLGPSLFTNTSAKHGRFVG